MVSASEPTLSKQYEFEAKQVQLTSGILHIGGEVSKLSPFEYVQTDKRVYLPSQDALARALRAKGRLQKYIQRIEEREEIESLLEETFGERWYLAKDANDRAIFPKHLSSLKWTEQRITDLRPMIRNGFGQLYIPGSSIKGAIRTAIAYHMLKQMPKPHFSSEIEERIRSRMGRIGNKAKFDDELFMDKLFSDFALVYKGNRSPGKTSLPNTDFMRAVHITDSEPLLEQKETNKQGKPLFFNLPIVIEVIALSHFRDGKAKYKAPIYTEIVRHVRTQFTIRLDRKMLSWFHREQGMEIPFKTVDDILRICKEFAQEQWNTEHNYWQDIQDNPNARDSNNQPIALELSAIRRIYEPEKCPYHLRIGWASGMTGTTINLLLEDDLRAEIRDQCSPNQAPGFEAPKSRRVVTISSREIKFVPGWVKLEELKLC